MSKTVYIPTDTPEGAAELAIQMRALEHRIFKAQAMTIESQFKLNFDVRQWIERNEIAEAMHALMHQRDAAHTMTEEINKLLFERSVLEGKLQLVMEAAVVNAEMAEKETTELIRKLH